MAPYLLALSSLLACIPLAASQRGSTFAGSTSTFMFPPANVTATIPDPNFPDATVVGFAGPTPTGDEAEVIATAPAAAINRNIYPLVQPSALDGPDEDFDITQQWGELSPWQSVKSFGLDKASPQIPNGCKIVQAHLLHRHGARYPTGGSGPSAFATKLHAAATSGGFSATGPLRFLNTWTLKLGEEILTPFGRSQLFDLGVAFRVQYGELLKGFNDLPVFRTTSQGRMVDSALHFAAGFFGVQKMQTDYHQLITIEETGFNNTLAPYMTCPNAFNQIGGAGLTLFANRWANKYLQPALKRLSPFLKGVNMTIADVQAMQDLCAYETVSLGYSTFCGLFTREEWRGYGYLHALQFWYGAGPGSPLAAGLGIGYVQEMLSRLTKTVITDPPTTLNQTIINDETLFPLDQPIYVDATHDVVVALVLVAMNFTNFVETGPLPTDHIPENLSYNVNQLAPFASHLVGQVLSCPASDKPTHIRWLLNDAVLPLTGVRGCKPNNDGLCELSTYIEAMKQRIDEVDFEFSCFGNYTFPDPDNIVDGQLPRNLRH